jgi:DNA-binding transcriptional LysR family regulator
MSASWELYGTFLEVMRTRSLSAAARTLAVAQPTVRRRIAALEEALGVVLFTRATNGLVPTEAALAALPYVESMAATAHALVRSTSAPSGEERGTVRLTASEVVGGEVLPPVLTHLSRQHPGLQVELVLSNRTEDLLRRDADLAVRMVAPTQQALVARKVGEVPLGLFAHETYLASRPPPRRLADLLRGHALVGNDRQAGVREALQGMGLAVTPAHFTFRSDSDLAQLAAVRAGLGIGVCQLPLAGRTPGLRRVLPSLTPTLGVWVVMHEDLRSARRVRRVFEHLVAHLGAYVTGAAAR